MLHERGFSTYLLEEETLQAARSSSSNGNISKSATATSTKESIRQIGEVAKLFLDAGVIVLADVMAQTVLKDYGISAAS